jgi:UDP-glucuronate 4-epimerase
VEIAAVISLLEKALGKKAKPNFLPMQPGDVPATFADTADLSKAIGFAPQTPIQQGIDKFVEWYRSFYGV